MNLPTKVLLVVAGLAAAGEGAFLALRRPPSPTAAPAATPAAEPGPPAGPDCWPPGPPPVPPNGATASQADMALGHDVMQAFVVQLENYQTCRNTRPTTPPQACPSSKSRHGSNRATARWTMPTRWPPRSACS